MVVVVLVLLVVVFLLLCVSSPFCGPPLVAHSSLLVFVSGGCNKVFERRSAFFRDKTSSFPSYSLKRVQNLGY